MKYENLYELINEAAKEALGKDAIIVKDNNSLKLLNDIILSKYKNTEKFYISIIKIIKRKYYSKIMKELFEVISKEIKNDKNFDFCVINEKDSIAIVNINKLKKNKKLSKKIDFLMKKYDEIYYIEEDKEIFNKIYDLYRRDFKYKDYINYKGGYKYGKIH